MKTTIESFIKKNSDIISLFITAFVFVLAVEFCSSPLDDESYEFGEVEYLETISDWDVFYEALTWVESRWDSTAVNPRSGAIGMMQCMPSGTGGFLDECNRILGYEKYVNDDLIFPSVQREIFEVVNERHNPNKSISRAISLHNSKAKPSYKAAILEKYDELLEYYYNENFYIVNETIE